MTVGNTNIDWVMLASLRERVLEVVSKVGILDYKFSCCSHQGLLSTTHPRYWYNVTSGLGMGFNKALVILCHATEFVAQDPDFAHDFEDSLSREASMTQSMFVLPTSRFLAEQSLSRRVRSRSGSISNLTSSMTIRPNTIIHMP